MRQDQPPRIFLGITEIAGYYENLACGFEELGVSVTSVDLLGHRFRYLSTHCPRWIRTISAALRRVRGDAGAGLSFRKICWGIGRQVASLLVLAWAIPRHDVFVFSWGTSFAHGYDLPLLRRLGKRTVLVFHGSDARPPYLSPARRPDGPPDGAWLIRSARLTKLKVQRLERHADHIICHPTYGHFFSKPLISFVAIGIPYPLADRSVATRSISQPVRVLHAPSIPTIKGTPLVHQAVAGVRRRGREVELVEITGRPHHEVIEAIRECDLVIDQAYSDTPMAGLAAEAAANGRPALVGGYGLSDIALAEQDPQFPTPTTCCEPDELEDALDELVLDPVRRERLGLEAASFMRKAWTPAQVAERYMAVLDGRWPPGLIRDPSDIRYVHGCGLSHDRLRAAVRAVVTIGGRTALQLDDKPTLRAEILRMAGLDDHLSGD